MAQDVQYASISQQDEPSVVDDLPARRIRRPTARALAMLEDTFPEGPNPVEEIQSDDASTSSSRLLKQLTSIGIRLKSAGKDHGIKNA